MPPNLSDDQVAELARQQAQLDLSDEQVATMARQQATKDLLAEGPMPPQPPGPDFNQRFIRPAILPTGLGIAGGIAGGRLAGPVGSALGGSVGSGVGEGINQLTGISEPSMTNLGAAFAVPLAMSGAGAAVSKAAPFLMPGRWSQALNAAGPEAAAAAVGKLAPKVSSSQLFDVATKAQVKIPMNRTVAKVDTLLNDLTQPSAGVQGSYEPVIKYLNGIKNLLQTNPQGLTPLALQRELEGVGNVVATTAAGGTKTGAIKQAFKAMVNDLDDAVKMANPAQAGARALVAARDAFKRESVVKEIGEAIDNAIRTPAGQGALTRFDASKVINRLRGGSERLSKFYQEAFTDTERTQLEKLLTTLNKIPALRPPTSANFGSGKYIASMGTTGGLGFAAGHGDPVTTGLAVAAGAAIPAMTEIGKDVALALQLGSGRALLGELLKQSKGTLTPNVASVIGAYAQAVRAGQVND